MQIFDFHQELWLPRPRGEIFEFFSSAHNLEVITPPWIRFKTVAAHPIEMKAGTLIDYKLRIRGVPVRWQSEITVWEPPHRFVDEQRKGPYRLWRHEHLFEEVEGGTRCLDHVRYAVIGGKLINDFFVRHDVEKIFAYRKEKLIEHFR